MGHELSLEDLQECRPHMTNAEMEKTHSVNGTPLDPDAPAIPCGTVAKSLFNDTFALYRNETTVNETIIK